MVLGIIDYGGGNILSVRNALERLGAQTDVISDPDDKYSGYVIPGVGRFDSAMPTMECFRESMGTRPVFGICIGMHVMYPSSEEGKMQGLGILSGSVVRIPPGNRVPHMGWNTIDEISPSSTLFDGIEPGAYAYFMHSYKADAVNETVTAVSNYGEKIPAAVEKDNYFATQFHPEKSGETGNKVLENFLEVCRR